MKILFIIFGCISLALGVMGIFLPLLPTTPFLLLSATLFLHSSPELHKWLLEHRIFGRYIRDYQQNRSMPMRAKLGSVTLLWISILYCIVIVLRSILWAQIALAIVAIAVSWHILSLGTTPRDQNKK